MRSMTWAVFLCFSCLFSVTAQAQGYEQCNRKLAHLEKQLAASNTYGNYHKQKTLEQSIERVIQACQISANKYTQPSYAYSGTTGATYKQSRQNKQQRKIEQKQDKVIQLEFALARSILERDWDAIERNLRKLGKAREDLDRAQRR
ncbi:DUF1090 family protein [Pseudomonas sp. F1_0610]|uniref:DUF1090 family protein n=1 Tax=Pseudomonas sp. F1_0610 TaxID=3114284 RepID=UPI0039C27631